MNGDITGQRGGHFDQRVGAAVAADHSVGRGVIAARGADDRGVLVVWNTQNAEARDSVFTGSGTLCINPLNWRSDATPAGKKLNRGAIFFDHKESNPTLKVKRVPRFCGAAADPDNGIVTLIEMPKACPFKIGSRQFDSDIWGVLSGNVSRNARERVSMFRFSKTGFELPK